MLGDILQARMKQAIALASHPTAIKAFLILSNKPGTNGWAIAKEVDADVKDIQESLEVLKDLDLVKSDQPGLDGNYALTSNGLKMRGVLSNP
jgi:hypothetical protein